LQQTGFTLLELMIVVAIIGIIASIAYPSYQEQVRQTRRANAQASLMELASYMERFYTENFTYNNANLPFSQSPKSGTAFYQITLPVATTTAYTLRATAQGGQAADAACTPLTITQTGATGPAGCW
ncbi:hypothetical protein LCGC14_1522670, partial [marine sediment metagenome]